MWAEPSLVHNFKLTLFKIGRVLVILTCTSPFKTLTTGLAKFSSKFTVPIDFRSLVFFFKKKDSDVSALQFLNRIQILKLQNLELSNLEFLHLAIRWLISFPIGTIAEVTNSWTLTAGPKVTDNYWINQSAVVVVTCSWHEARENLRERDFTLVLIERKSGVCSI